MESFTKEPKALNTPSHPFLSEQAMRFCEKCGAYINEKVRKNGYLICTNGHLIEDEATKAIQEREKREALSPRS